jgi:diguanylate cyclase (GGDEF)-like protein
MTLYATALLLGGGLALLVRRRMRGAGVGSQGVEEEADRHPPREALMNEPAPPVVAAGLEPGGVAGDRDEVTRLPDARHLEDKFAALRSDPYCLTLLAIDVEGWQRTGDPGGNPHEDRALLEVAHTVKSILRSGDTCVRGEGSRLMAVLPGLDPETSAHLVTRVRQAVESLTLVTHAGGEVQLGVSVGRAFMPEDGDSLDALVAAARRDIERGKAAPRGGLTAGERLSRAVPLVSN